MKHLHLQHKFTDRGGREVYEIHNADDSKRLKKPLGSIRIPQPGALYQSTHVDWLNDNELEAGNVPEHDPDQLELDV